jgi:hypothetical protein
MSRPITQVVHGLTLDTTGMTNPMTTTGDVIYSSSGSTPARLGIGTAGQVLTVAGGVPSWATPAGGSGMTLLHLDFSAVTSLNNYCIYSIMLIIYCIHFRWQLQQASLNNKNAARGTTYHLVHLQLI